MSNLVAIVYPDEYRAAEVLAALRRLESNFQINLADACTLTRDRDGKVKLHQTFHVTEAGAIVGGLWGLLAGVVFMNPLAGLAAGAAAGALSGRLSDHGIPDRFMKELGERIGPGSSAIFLLLRMAHVSELEAALAPFGGHVLYTDLAPETAAHLETLLRGTLAPA